MALELTSTRRRTPLAETTFVTRVPSYMDGLGAVRPRARPRLLPPLSQQCPRGTDDTIEWRRRDGRPGVRYGDHSPGPAWDDYRVVCRPRAASKRAFFRRPRRYKRFARGIGETTFVTRVPPYIQGDLGQHAYGPRGEATRELMGFGDLDASVATSEVQGLLRKAGYCDVGPVDNRWGPNTEGALREFAEDQAARRAGAALYVAAEDWSAERRSGTVRLDSGLLGKLRFAAAGETDECPMVPVSPPTREPALEPMPGEDEGVMRASVFASPMLWLGIAAAAGVAYYAYTQYEGGSDDMMMMPPRL